MKKFIALLLALMTIFTMTIPAFAAENGYPENSETEISYIDNLSSVYSAGAKNLTNGIVLTSFAAIAAIPLCMVPFGAIAVFAGIPSGMVLTAIGAGELVTAPVIAAFMDESTDLEPIEGFDAEEFLEPLFNCN